MLGGYEVSHDCVSNCYTRRPNLTCRYFLCFQYPIIVNRWIFINQRRDGRVEHRNQFADFSEPTRNCGLSMILLTNSQQPGYRCCAARFREKKFSGIIWFGLSWWTINTNHSRLSFGYKQVYIYTLSWKFPCLGTVALVRTNCNIEKNEYCKHKLPG